MLHWCMSSTSLLWVGMPRGRWHSSWFGGLCCKPSPLMQQGIYWRELYPRALIESWHEPYGADCFPFRLRIQGPREDRNMYMYGWIPLVFTWSLFTTLLIGCIPIQNKKWKKKKSSEILSLFCMWRYSKEVGEGNGNPLRYSCLENPMDRKAW